MSEEMKMGEILQARRDTQSSRWEGGGPVLHTVIMEQQLEPFKENLCSLLILFGHFLTSVPKGSSTRDAGGSQDFRIWITAS